MIERTVTVSEFKAKCLELLRAIDAGTVHRVTVTRRGQPVAVVQPPDDVREARARAVHGCMKGQAIVAEDFDLVKGV